MVDSLARDGGPLFFGEDHAVIHEALGPARVHDNPLPAPPTMGQQLKSCTSNLTFRSLVGEAVARWKSDEYPRLRLDSAV
jgi:hypothetical protein